MLASTEGVAAVRLARHAVESVCGALGDRPVPSSIAGPVFQEPRGVFVTWKEHPGGGLRGCIGFPRPVLPLRQAIEEAAVAAAVEDPRFPPVTDAELARLCVEVSVLSVPVVIDGPDRARAVFVGRDGVIVQAGRSSGLLLPQVAVEQGWSPVELLDATCEKAGLRSGDWRRPETRVETFQADVFGERAPSGPVDRLGTVPGLARVA